MSESDWEVLEAVVLRWTPRDALGDTADRNAALAALSRRREEEKRLREENARMRKSCNQMGKKLMKERVKAMGRKLALNDLGRAKDASDVRRELRDAHQRVTAERDELRRERNAFHSELTSLRKQLEAVG